MNSHLIETTIAGYDNSFLVSPRTLTGIKMDFIQQLFYQSYLRGHTTKKQLSDHAWQILKSKGQGIVQDGDVLTTEQQNLEELEKRAANFLTTKVTHLKSYQML